MRLMFSFRISSDGRPIIVAVVAAIADQGIVGSQAAGSVMLHQRQPFGHSGAHLSPVGDLYPVRRVTGHDLRQMKMILQFFVRYGGFQQRISVNIYIAHNTHLLIITYNITHKVI